GTADDRWQIVSCPVKSCSLGRPYKDHCYQQSKDQTKRHGHQCEIKGCFYRVPEYFVLSKHFYVIFQSHKFRRGQNIIITGGIVQRYSHGYDQEHQKADNKRKAEDHTHILFFIYNPIKFTAFIHEKPFLLSHLRSFT